MPPVCSGFRPSWSPATQLLTGSPDVPKRHNPIPIWKRRDLPLVPGRLIAKPVFTDDARFDAFPLRSLRRLTSPHPAEARIGFSLERR